MNQNNDIKALRKTLGWTQAEFGDALGVDQSTVSLWERNGPPRKGPARKILDSMTLEVDASPSTCPAYGDHCEAQS
ncbi:MAG: helix-turn-helix domain-containing protein [Rhizobium sp.]|nr:helix-turn-helix domain-containing protein [Rhizobium sp.]